MHYYQFNIGDYKSHTSHLDPLEDIAYRRMLDWYYLHEKPLPKGAEEIARLINMRTHCDSIAAVLKEFFIYDKKGKCWRNKRADETINFYFEKSEKARNSAKARWDKEKDDANALRRHCEGNANHKPITNNHKPIGINVGTNVPTSETAKRLPPVPIKSVVGKWNEYAEKNGLPLVVKQTSQIEGQIRQRWRDDLGTLDQWDNFFSYVMDSRFLSGRANPGNGRGKPFRATLAWITKESNFAKIAAGEYH